MINSIQVSNYAASKYSENEIIKTFNRIDVENFETNECIWWHGGTTNGGYGQLYAAGRMYGAHRVFYEILIGEIPEGLYLLHFCNNRACVNVKHLNPGTQFENMADRERAEHQFRKLSTEKVKEIKQLLFEGINKNIIAENFEISVSMVCNIASGKKHKNINL